MPKSAKEILAAKKKKDGEILTAQQKLKKNAINPNKRLNWKDTVRVTINGIIMTSNPNPDDKIVFTPDLIDKLAIAKYTVVPCYFNFDKDKLLGQSRINGRDVKDGVMRLIASTTVLLPKKLAEKLDQLTLAVKVSTDSYQKLNNKYVLKNCKLQSVSLIPKKNATDPFCIILETLKDSDIEERLAE